MEKGFGLMPGACKGGFSKELEGCERPGMYGLGIVCVCVCVCVCMYVCIYDCMYVCTCACMYVYT